MKFLVSLACMCLYLLVGDIFPIQSQQAGEVRGLYCNNGECETTVVSDGVTWEMIVDCGDGEYKFHGSGYWEGTLCEDMTMV